MSLVDKLRASLPLLETLEIVACHNMRYSNTGKSDILNFLSPPRPDQDRNENEHLSITRRFQLSANLCGGIRDLEADVAWVRAELDGGLGRHESNQITYSGTLSSDPDGWNGLDLQAVSAKQPDMYHVLAVVREEERKGTEEMKAYLRRAAEVW